MSKKKSETEKTLTPAEAATQAIANFKRAAARAEEAEKTAHSAALAAKKAKAVAQKAVEYLRLSAAETIKNWETVDETASKKSAALKAQREEV